LLDLREILEAQAQPLPDVVRRFAGRNSPFEFRSVQPVKFPDPEPGEPRLDVWFRAVDEVGTDPRRHAELLAYVSDYHLIGAALRPHGYMLGSTGVVVASIDHAMWFHRPVRVDDWLLYSIESPVAAGARGFARASIFTRNGLLVASTAQEGLMRVMRS
jgi:acyl-CoA thioesterase-2